MREIDDAKIRTEAVFIEAKANVLIEQFDRLEEQFVELGDEMEFADSVKDRDFEQFIVKISRALQCRHALRALSESAHDMQKFHLPFAESIPHAETPLLRHSETFITPEVAHA